MRNRRRRDNANEAAVFHQRSACLIIGSPERIKKIATTTVHEEAEYVCGPTGKPAVARLVIAFGLGVCPEHPPMFYPHLGGPLFERKRVWSSFS